MILVFNLIWYILGQMEGDLTDVRGFMHRDGSVFSSVSLDELKTPDKLYRSLGRESGVWGMGM